MLCPNVMFSVLLLSYCFLLLLTVLVGTAHNWIRFLVRASCEILNWLFVSPSQRADLGRVGWLTTCIPLPTTLPSSSKRWWRGSAGEPGTLTTLWWTITWDTTLFWVFSFGRAILCSPHSGGGHAETERNIINSLIVYYTVAHISYSFTTVVIPQLSGPLTSTGCCDSVSLIVDKTHQL